MSLQSSHASIPRRISAERCTKKFAKQPTAFAKAFHWASVLLLAVLLIACQEPSTGIPKVQTPLRPGQARIPAPQPGHRFRVDVLTVEPGSEIYSAWGHTALRILDTKNRIDVVFDYGLFDFSETFWIRFLMGKPAFMVGAYPMVSTIRRYRNDNRRIFAQQIYLSDAEAEALLERMKVNLLPQNRTFLYHHYQDNCTTRVRDRVDASLRGEYRPFFAGRASPTNYRKASMHLLLGRPWLWFGTNLILGSTIDHPIDRWQEQFLPIHFMNALERFRKSGHEDKVAPIEVVLEPIASGFRIDVSAWWGLIAGLSILIFAFFGYPLLGPHARGARILGRSGYLIWHGIAGLCGLVLSLAWAFTNHDTVFWNLNLLGYSPLLLVVPILHIYWKRRDPRADLLLHRFLIAPPLLGALMSLLGLLEQFSWPFLFFAAMIQTLVYLRLSARLSLSP